MGAIPYTGGVTFRVWAPFARAVGVAGASGTHPLAGEGNGFWSADVAGAAIGDEYKLVIDGVPKKDPYGWEVTNSAGSSVVSARDYAWSPAAFAMPPWNELVIYELHIGTFTFAPGRRGTFDSAIARLDHVRDLGCNAVQIMPSDEFPGDISWGYNPSDLFAIESSYGGHAGLYRFVEAAHARGLAVVFDVVYNHFGPEDLDLWRFDGWHLGDNGGGIYFYNDWRIQTPWGSRPDYGRGEVRQFIRDDVLHWLLDCRLDGLRWDATGWIRNVWGHGRGDPGADLADGWSLLQWCNGEIDARQPWKLSIAEDMQDDPSIVAPLSAGGAGFDAQWAAGFMHALRGIACQVWDDQRDVGALAGFVAQPLGGAFQRVLYTESHDEVAASNGGARLPEAIAPGDGEGYYAQKRSTLAAAVLFVSPGIPMLFMGQEMLAVGAWSDAVELDWSRADRFAGIVALYRDLAHLRRNWFDTTRGLRGDCVHVSHVNPIDRVLAIHRWAAGGARDDVVTLVNFGARAYDAYRIGLPRPGRWRVRFNSDWRGYSAAFGGHPSYDLDATSDRAHDGMAWGGDIGIGAYSAIVLSQD